MIQATPDPEPGPAPIPIGSGDRCPPPPSAGETPQTREDEEVLTALEKLDRTRTPAILGLFFLAISLLLFIFLGLFRDPLEDTLLLVGVILLHETGHYTGMKLFGFHDVKMFFIPLFGGAVSGKSARATESQRALVSLLGPFVGLLTASIILLNPALIGIPWLAKFGFFSLGINFLNLLPVFPLDGGRLLEHLLFGRRRDAEAAFRTLAGLSLMGAGTYLEGWILVVLGTLILISIPSALRIRTLAEEIRRGPVPLPEPAVETPPRPIALVLLARLRTLFPRITKPRALAQLIQTVWQRANVRPAGCLGTVLILAAYASTILLTFSVLFVALSSPAGRRFLNR